VLVTFTEQVDSIQKDTSITLYWIPSISGKKQSQRNERKRQ